MKPTSAAEAERQAERLRAELAGTLDQIAGNLMPRRILSDAAAATRNGTPQWLTDYWNLARGPVGLGLVGATAASVAVGFLTKGRRRR